MQHVRVSSHQSPVHKLGDAQMRFSPKFRLQQITPPPPCPLDSDFALESGALIPGLPDDISLNCLLRLPISCHLTCRGVCRRWHHLFASKELFFTQRRALGFTNPFLFIFAFHRCTGRIQWQVLDLTHFSWHSIPAMPCRDRVCPHGFGCVAIPSEGSLLVCGGIVSDMDCPLHLVLKFEVCRNRWTVMPKMHKPRSFFADGVIDGKVYVAGGFSTDQFELDSAEVFDPTEGSWRQVAGMQSNMSSYDSAVLSGKLYVTEGWVWPFLSSPRGQFYDPRTNAWEPMAVGMREGWTGLSVVVDEHLFVISDHEGMRLKAYEMESDSWKAVEGSPLPERIRKPISVCSIGGNIYVIGRGLNVAIGLVKRVRSSVEPNSNGGNLSFSIQWNEIDVPRAFCDLTPASTQVLFA
ncbi:F-box/kelch-repeat protein [Apostasia shenzhenica]|uniref:F-box/kelch-repeat protein n=1 Tax=Apostasia shenzhenica TaxID=1088818 RepID=A0A2I0A5Q5_9ASPA|nr:F-box/kelch-repeat protein [Apostasia shenzhenica]